MWSSTHFISLSPFLLSPNPLLPLHGSKPIRSQATCQGEGPEGAFGRRGRRRRGNGGGQEEEAGRLRCLRGEEGIRRRKRQWRQRRRGVAAVLPGGELPRRSDRGEEVPPEAQGLRGALEGALRAGRRPPAEVLPAMQQVPRAVGVRRDEEELPQPPGGAQRAAQEELLGAAGGELEPLPGGRPGRRGDHADEQPPRKPCLQAFPDQIRSMLPLFCHPPSLFLSSPLYRCVLINFN
ncbi:squamosa promoter-binding protein 1 [Iris pallida]|uniref:Squamosa promoter-binding protein 1 n=1 Tax=Iris pallida TaxID=29817 RepID=A0AAX6IJY3_IRIPA|nr:squamosa promoter-binding protein 1 [Iris pallida]